MVVVWSPLPSVSVRVTLPLSRHNQLSQSADQLTTHSIPPASPPTHCSLLAVVEWKIQNFHIRKLFLGVPGTSTTTGLWSPPSPGSLNHNPSWQHSPGPGHSALVSHHPPSQPVSRWPVPMFRQSPVCWPAQAAASSSSQPRLLFPGSLRTAARDPARQHPATTAAPAALYSVQCVQYSVYSGDECGEQGMEECPVAAPPAPAPAHHLGCAARDQQC